MWFLLTDKEPEDQTAWLPSGTGLAEVTLLGLEPGPPGPKPRTTPPARPPVPATVQGRSPH